MNKISVAENNEMEILKRIVLTILILTALTLIFRGWVYRHLVVYKSIGLRPTYLVRDENLVASIEANIGVKKQLGAKEIIPLGLVITSKQLNFTPLPKNSTDPNKLIYSKTAHCVGYASFYSTICNYLLKKYNIGDTWIAKPQEGQLYFLGKNIHKCFNSPFFKDHDFVMIENKSTGEVFAVDPLVNDYFYIDLVTYVK